MKVRTNLNTIDINSKAIFSNFKLLSYNLKLNEIKSSASVIIKNVGWLLLDKLIKMSIGLFVGVWIARYLEPSNYGIFSYALTLIGIISVIADLGLQNISIRELVNNPNQKKKILGSTVLLKFFGSIAAYLLVIISINILRPDENLVITTCLILGMKIFWKVGEDISIIWFESIIKAKYIVIGQNSVSLLFVLAKIYMLLNEYQLIDFVIITTVEAFFISIVLLLFFNFKAFPINQLNIDLKKIKDLLSSSWPLLFSNLFIVIYMGIDQIMIGQILDDFQVGVYAAAVKLSEIWYFFPMVICSTLFPVILKLKSSSNELYIKRLQLLFDFMVIVSFTVAVIISLFSGKIIQVIYGDDYSMSAAILSLHIWASIFVFLGVASDKWILAEDKQILSFQRSIAGVVINLILNLILIPEYGALGAAIATVISYSVSAFFIDMLQKSTYGIFIMKLKSMNIFLGFRRLNKEFTRIKIFN